MAQKQKVTLSNLSVAMTAAEERLDIDPTLLQQAVTLVLNAPNYDALKAIAGMDKEIDDLLAGENFDRLKGQVLSTQRQKMALEAAAKKAVLSHPDIAMVFQGVIYLEEQIEQARQLILSCNAHYLEVCTTLKQLVEKVSRLQALQQQRDAYVAGLPAVQAQ